jgi:hypothetical protein
MITSFFTPKRKAEDSNEKGSATNTVTSSSPIASAEREDRSRTSNIAKRLKSNTLDTTKKTELIPAVQELMSALTDDEWKVGLEAYVAKPSFASLATFVANERKTNKTIYPLPSDTFTALNLVPLNKVKVVIVGQDPYHGPGQGHGLCFSYGKESACRHLCAISTRSSWKMIADWRQCLNMDTLNDGLNRVCS